MKTSGKRMVLGTVIHDGKEEVGRAKYIIIDKSFIDNNPQYDFLIDDMQHVITDGAVDRIIYILELYVNKKYRLKYFGSELLNTLANQYNDSAIVLRASALIAEYPVEPTKEEYDELIPSLVTFFNKNGYASINAYCGFECSEAMLYIGNDVGRDIYYDLLIGGYLSKRINIQKTVYSWKDIVKINGQVYAEEAPISGEMDGDRCYNIDDFMVAVASKHGVKVDDIETYMMDNIDFDARELEFGAEDCGCYINGVAEWTLQNVAEEHIEKVGEL